MSENRWGVGVIRRCCDHHDCFYSPENESRKEWKDIYLILGLGTYCNVDICIFVLLLGAQHLLTFGLWICDCVPVSPNSAAYNRMIIQERRVKERCWAHYRPIGALVGGGIAQKWQ